MEFYYLLLGHLLGDFTFQTDRIAANKNKELHWILLHSIIVTLSMLIFSIPFGSKLILLVILNGLLHFLIDFLKTKLAITGPVQAFIYFLIDQAVHIYIIFLLASFYVKKEVKLPFDQSSVLFMVAFLFTLSFSAIFVQMILKISYPNKNQPFFYKNERTIGNLTRTITFLILFFAIEYSSIILSLTIVLFIMLWLIFKNSWYRWMSKGYFWLKLVLDFSMGFIGFLIFISLLGLS